MKLNSKNKFFKQDLALNNAAQRQVIDKIICGGYFLGTYHNPLHKQDVTPLNDASFDEMILTRLDAAHPKYADVVVITPMRGYYLGIPELSYMISFNAIFTAAQYMELTDIMTSLFKDLGQDSFIFRHTNQTHCLINAQTGKADMVGQEIEFKENALCYSIINDIPFTMELKNADK